MKYITIIVFLISSSLTFSQSRVRDNCTSTFESFFEKFSINEKFQKENIKYPLKLTYVKDLETSSIETKVYKNQTEWKFIDFTEDSKAKDREYDQYEVIIVTSNQKKLYKLIGIDNGINVVYQFERIKGCWKLTLIKDESA
ncbi:DUF4348 domain-containing protein [Tenacibaculum sp. MEBiC06402]|uniref:DUF4348 domain-containing protein n=1 Tax=unclassified Tenacibaculum TaxID=2635139 RepID=UPI003B995509